MSKLKKQNDELTKQMEGKDTALVILEHSVEETIKTLKKVLGKCENRVANCTICKQSMRMITANNQAMVHVGRKHPGKTFDECFPGFTCS